MQIADYSIRDTLYQGRRCTVYRALNDKDGTQAILKVAETAQRGGEADTREYDLLQRVDSEHVIRAREQIQERDRTILVLEDIGGSDLKTALAASGAVEPQAFPDLAIGIVKGLAAIHQAGIIHKDLNPANIIRNPETGEIKIIDFDIAATYTLKQEHAGNPEHLAGTLPYISPEQTGRMNRSVDWRSDLYSLGVTFYELLTGRRPFESRDPMELVHAHLAQIPAAPCDVIDNSQLTIDNSQLSILSDIIMKLLAKNAEERYQSAEGLLYDLERVQEINLTGLEDLSGFTLATRDFSGRLQIPEKLYGRERELEQLADAYQRVSRGKAELLLVAGYSGTGKTALVNELRKSLSRDRGTFVSGKFELLQRNIPYHAILQALNQFCALLLSEDRETLAAWKTRLDEALGSLGRVLTDLLPALEAIVGPQPELPQVEGIEARNRFHYVFPRFLRAIARPEHPLLIFLDDLQWADQASLDLLKLLMEDSASGQALLCIGAYRDNEVSETHPLMILKNELHGADAPLQTLTVENLPPNALRQWVGDSLRGGSAPEPQALDALTAAIVRKTGGNAFFSLQFLTLLAREGLLSFDRSGPAWSWDLSAIEGLSMTNNIVDLLVHRLRALPSAMQECLRLAACVGNVFEAGALAAIGGQPAQLAAAIESALEEQFILPLEEERYRFVHDHIQQAAYALIPEAEQAPLHLRIGRILLKNSGLLEHSPSVPAAGAAGQAIFALVQHFNRAFELIEDEDERLDVARLNLLAARQAKASGAYQSGWDYIQQALAILPPQIWRKGYELALAVHNEAIQLAYLSSRYGEIECLGAIVLASAQSVLDRSTVYEYQIMGQIAQNEFTKAVDHCLEVLGDLRIKIPRHRGEKDVTVFAETKALLEEKGSEGIISLPPMQDEEKTIALRLYFRSSNAFVFGAQDLYPFVVNKMLLLSLQHGVTPETAYLLVEYGLLNVFAGNLAESYHYSILSQKLLEKLEGFDSMKMRVLALQYLYITHWSMPYPELAERFWELSQYGIRTGDLEWSSYSLLYHFLLLRYIGGDLSLVEAKGENFLDAFDQLKQPIMRAHGELWFRAIQHFTGSHPEPGKLSVDFSPFLPVMTDDGERMLTFNSAPAQLLLNLLFERDEIVDCAEIFSKSPLLTGTIEYPNYVFYATLHGLQRCKQHEGDERQALLEGLQTGLGQVQGWAEAGPANFLHRQHLLQAETAALEGKAYEAGKLYDQAIETARQNRFLCDEALANELAAKFYQQQERETLAACYFRQAYHCYQRWGARAKVRQMEERYPKYIRQTGLPAATSETTSSGVTAAALDIHTILKTTRILSGTVQLKALLENMMRLAIENAGAQRGCFIEAREEELLIQASGDAHRVSDILAAIPVEDSGRLPMALINYVAHSKEQQVFDNLSQAATHRHDPYVQEHQPQSAACVPVLKQGELTAILYLENNAVEGAFTPARLEVLNMLSAQIAISVKNAELYENLEEKVQQRTEELRQAHSELQEAHKALSDNVSYSARIQQAVLPEEETLTTLFPEHFILFLPHSTVSGDFYWTHSVGEQIVVAAVDCTGHGVTGALLSMLGSAFLNDIVPTLAAEGRLEANAILDALREKVKSALKQRGEFGEQREGMDLALCVLDPAEQTLQFAGAYNPLYLIRKGESIELKADRMPIGIHRKEKPFSKHDIRYQSGDMLYLFSDGFQDQHSSEGKGGFGKKRFKQLLLDIHQQEAFQQREALLRAFNTWKGARGQTDDVLVLGFRL